MIAFGPSLADFSGDYAGAATYVSGAGIGLPRVPDCSGWTDGLPSETYNFEPIGILSSGTAEHSESTTIMGAGGFEAWWNLAYGPDELENGQYYIAAPYCVIDGVTVGLGHYRVKTTQGHDTWGYVKLATSQLDYLFSIGDGPITHTWDDWGSILQELIPVAETFKSCAWFRMSSYASGTTMSLGSVPDDSDAVSINGAGFTGGSFTVGVKRISNFEASVSKGSVAWRVPSLTTFETVHHTSGWVYEYPYGYRGGCLLSGTIETEMACYGNSDFEVLTHLTYGQDALSAGQYYGAIPYVRSDENYYGTGYLRHASGWCHAVLTGSAIPIFMSDDVQYDLESALAISGDDTIIPWFCGKRIEGQYSYTSYPKLYQSGTAVWSTPVDLSGAVHYGVMHIGNFTASMTKGSASFDVISSTIGNNNEGSWRSALVPTLGRVVSGAVSGASGWPTVTYTADGQSYGALPSAASNIGCKISTVNPPSATVFISEPDDVLAVQHNYDIPYLTNAWVSKITITDSEAYGMQDWQDPLCVPSTCEIIYRVRQMIEYDGDSEGITTDNICRLAHSSVADLYLDLGYPLTTVTVSGATTEPSKTKVAFLRIHSVVNTLGHVVDDSMYSIEGDQFINKGSELRVVGVPRPVPGCAIPVELIEALALLVAYKWMRTRSADRAALYLRDYKAALGNFRSGLVGHSLKGNKPSNLPTFTPLIIGTL